MSFRKVIFFSILFLNIAGGVTAQKSFIVKHYTRQDYQGGHQNWSLDSDQKGFIYAGNNSGLLVFDGSRWSRFSDSSLFILRSVMVAGDGKIYTGSYEEFGYWQKDASQNLKYHSLKHLLKNYSFHNNEIWKIVQQGNKIYFQSFSSLFVYDGKSVRSIDLPGNVLFLLKAGNRLFIQVIGKGLYEVINEKLLNLDPEGKLAATEVKTILPFSDSTFLVGTTSDGLFLLGSKGIESWKVPAGERLKQYQINNGLVMGDYFVFGTIVSGVFITDRNGQIINHLNFDNALQNNTILSMYLDNSGSLWLGMDKGIDNVSLNQPLSVYLEEAGIIGAVYTAALSGKRLYVGTNRGVFTYLYAGEDFLYEGMIPNSQGQVWQIKEIDGTLLCGHNNGTYIINGKSFEKISDVTGGFSLQPLFKNNQKYLIQSTYSTLTLYEKINRGWKFSKLIQGFIEPSRYLETDHLENIWVSHAIKGLYKLKISNDLSNVTALQRLGKKDGFPSDFNIRVFKIANRVVFTSGYQLYTWDDLHEKIIPLHELNRLLSGFESAEAISDAGNNRYWFIRKNDIALFAFDGFKPAVLYRLLLPLYNLSMPDNYENVINLNDSLNLICLDNGFAIFNSHRIHGSSMNRGKLIWSDCYSLTDAGEQQLLDTHTKNLTLPYRYNTVSFAFSLLNSPGITKQFQYKLDGIDSEWSNWTDKAEIKYTRLPHGKYRFHVRSITASGIVTEPLEFDFYIRKPWYLSALAWVVYSVLTVVVIFIAFHLYRRRITKHHEQLRNEEIQKREKEKQLAEQEIITLQNQNLQAEVSHKNMQLADSTMALIKKNELLIEIKNELLQQKELLGNRYPTRYFDKISKLIDKNISNDNDWKLFESLFDQAHQNFFKRLKASYPDLTQSDLKLCAYLKLNLSSKEIAPLLNISLRGVEIRRYRLRKRLGLTTDYNLVEFIMQI